MTMDELHRAVRNGAIPEPPAGWDVRDFCRDCGRYHGGAITCSEAAEQRGGA